MQRYNLLTESMTSLNTARYVRTALRMVSDRVLTQHDVVSDTWLGPGVDCIGLAAYTVDVPGPVQTILMEGQVVNEGALKVPTFCDPNVAPFVRNSQIVCC
jgi:hypothetical protein